MINISGAKSHRAAGIWGRPVADTQLASHGKRRKDAHAESERERERVALAKKKKIFE